MGANIKIVLVFVAGTQNLIQSLERSAFKGTWLLENVFYCQLTLRPLLVKIGLRRWRQKPFKLLKKWSHLWKRRSVLCRQQSRSAHTPDTTFFAYDLKKVATSFSDNGSFWAFTGAQPFKTLQAETIGLRFKLLKQARMNIPDLHLKVTNLEQASPFQNQNISYYFYKAKVLGLKVLAFVPYVVQWQGNLQVESENQGDAGWV